MGLDLPAAMNEVEQERMHSFHIQTPQGMASVDIPHAQMKCCPCGCDRFQKHFHVCFAKPNNILGAQTMTMQVEVYACAECGKEMEPATPTVQQVKNPAPAA